MTEPTSMPVPEPGDQQIEDLLFEALELLAIEGPAAVEALLARHPDLAARVRSHLERLHCVTMASGSSPAAANAQPERLGEFRILSPLGQGGMGVVYRAVQESLGREVALKLIRPEQMFFPGARERFRREVELVARMQHPGIVPVHAVGSDGGVPYFAMELVHGASLADVVLRLQGQNPKDLTGRDLDRATAACLGESDDREPAELFRGGWVQVVLRIVREVAEALEHAHRRGVLHRDVKPSNVMLTRDGRVLLFDFGLAGADGAERLTRSGSALGSLAYMPPELLAGEPAVRDARSDVYSLGATCWELLTLRLPYQSSDPVQLQRLAGAATRPKLSSLNPGVPWDVETVVATALEPEPARRYASASLFARDLDHLLAHRPIEAREAGVRLRLRRWSQRHPARATASLAAAVLLVGGPSLWAWQESRTRAEVQVQRDALASANVELEQARHRADVESARARSNFTKLQQAVDTMLTKVGDESLRDIPRLDEVRRDLLQEALRFYEGFLVEQPDDPELLAEASHVRLRAADVQALLGDYDAAAQLVARVMQDLGDRTDDVDLAIDVAQAQSHLAATQRLRGDGAGAQTTITAALARWQAIPAPDDVRVAHGFADASLEASFLDLDHGDAAAALAVLEQSLAALAAWNAAHAGSAQLAHTEARTLDRAGVCAFEVACRERDPDAARAGLQRALELHQRSAALWPSVLADTADATNARGHAAENAFNIALAQNALGRPAEAKPQLEHAVELYTQVVAEHPTAQHLRASLATARIDLAGMLAGGGDLTAAARELTAAQDLYEQLLQAAPSSGEYLMGLAHALLTRAQLAQYGGDAAAALPLAEHGGEIVDRLLALRPRQPTCRYMRRTGYATEAAACLATGAHARAAAAVRHMLDPRLAPASIPLAASLLVRAGTVAGDDTALAADARTGQAANYRAEAVALLDQALADGAKLAQLRVDPELQQELQQPDVAAFWADYAAQPR